MIAVARINRLFGVDGQVFINLYSEFPDDFSHDKPLFVKVDTLSVPLYVEKFERRGRTTAQVRFADIDTERRVSEFMGQELFFDNSESVGQEYEEEFFLDDLVGFKAIANGVEGELTEFYDNPNNPLFGLTISDREVLIPAAEEFIVRIDFQGHQIEFLLPEGLLEL